MPPVRTMYTREELLRIASLASAMDLGPEVLRKFDVIEVAEPVPGPKRRESELNFKSSVLTDNFSTSTAITTTGPNGSGNTGGKANHSSGMNGGGSNNHTSSSSTPGYSAGGGRGCDNRRGGGNGGRDDSGSGSFKQSGYDRFAPPEGRFSRGSRNQETFEEGIEYELRQSALQKKRVAETMEREDRKGEHLRQALEKFKQEGNDAAAAEAERETDEIERLLAGITMIDDAPKTVVRSRFFSAQGPMTASAEPPTAMPLPPPPPAATTLSFGTTASSSAPATTGVPQASVLATPAKSGTPGYATGPWSSMKSDSNLWSTAPSMASALKQSLQQPSSPAATSPPLQIRSQQPALQQSQPPTRPASDPQPGKSMGTVAAATSTNSVSAQSSSGSGGFGVHAPAQASLPAPPQGSVLGSASGNSNTGIGAAIGGKAGVPTSAGQPQGPPHTSPQTPSPNLPQASRPAPATATKPAPRSGGSTGVPTGAWSAAELEFLLKKGTAVKSSAPALPSSTGASATTAQKTQPITAAELESLLMKRARQGSGATGTGMSTLPPSPPQFQQPPPPQQASLLFANPAKTPTMPANSNPAVAPLSLPQQLPASMMAPNGAMLTPKQPLPPPPPPMPSQMPTHPQPQPPHHSQPQQHQQSPWVAMPRPPQAPPASQPSGNGSPMHNTPPLQPLAAKMQHPASMMPNGLQMPMQMNPQGQYFVDSAQLQRVYMTGQPMMFRRPDGTVFMQTQHMAQPQPQQAPPHPQQPFNPFGTNAQFLFQQQQRR
ncbi:conserved hypothetical protein [Leishmania braziliensis MHOM/BR/75/M2904]|uniref:4E-interacting protein n=2 Tax=Leishmania braziliensis TaxID=5660 RepID=A4HN68_LEIBR|nr:conserved hypothetical protein [Leishmania braziliensis MHOM/BR/75/M2904]KAI5689467.1 hypothetical protein MNV84_07632 [Leishmania braziliensis]CAJ2480673.1 unnamed protein product [Leishmania braziliensis]CAJ2481020.1 unnamed protein product [Leishmania braziliensis]CAM43613.1 conserved hypothetical protein [Leishmania braziliensis MHOM/BR/75/M2904]SYZ69669.1 4E-interacting_protein [Leishmania braziliensis MHOM/BR/75/M2904]